MPIYLGASMDENPPGAGPIVIFTATYALDLIFSFYFPYFPRGPEPL